MAKKPATNSKPRPRAGGSMLETKKFLRSLGVSAAQIEGFSSRQLEDLAQTARQTIASASASGVDVNAMKPADRFRFIQARAMAEAGLAPDDLDRLLSARRPNDSLDDMLQKPLPGSAVQRSVGVGAASRAGRLAGVGRVAGRVLGPLGWALLAYEVVDRGAGAVGGRQREASRRIIEDVLAGQQDLEEDLVMAEQENLARSLAGRERTQEIVESASGLRNIRDEIDLMEMMREAAPRVNSVGERYTPSFSEIMLGAGFSV